MRTLSPCTTSSGDKNNPNSTSNPIDRIVAIPRTRVNGVPVADRRLPAGAANGSVGELVPAARAAVSCIAEMSVSAMELSFLDQGSERQGATDTEQCDEDAQQAQPRP